MRDNHGKKRAPIICAVVVIVFLAAYLMLLVGPIIADSVGILAAAGILIVFGGAVISAIVGVILALKQRLREIESGEEEDASRY